MVTTARQSAHVRVAGFLGRALSLELGAVQQYMTHAALCETWGLNDESRHWREEAAGETQHAERIVRRMIALGVAPNASQLRAVKVAGNPGELIAHNVRMEQDIVSLYSDAVVSCLRSGDSDHAAFFQQLLAEEQGHARELQAWYESSTGGSSR
jgi:bacterioferritin